MKELTRGQWFYAVSMVMVFEFAVIGAFCIAGGLGLAPVVISEANAKQIMADQLDKQSAPAMQEARRADRIARGRR
jgi:hypothetical protein